MKKRIKELLDYVQPTDYIVESENYSNENITPVLTAGKTFILGYTDETDGIFVASKKQPIILFDDFTTSKKWVDFPFKVKSSACKILTPKDNVNLKYVFYALHRIPFDATQHMRYWISRYSNEFIRYPSKETQENIVKEFESIEENISNENNSIHFLNEMIKSRFIEMFKTIDMSEQRSDWVALKVVAKIHTGTTPSTSDDENWDGNILWITPAEMTKESFFITDTVRKITEKGRKSKSLDIMPINTVLLSTRAPIGKVGIVGSPMACNQGFKNFECSKKLNPIFLYTLLKANTVYLNSIGSGTTFMEISKTKISETKIPLPSIDLQNEFADFVQLVDKLKFNAQKRIELYQELLNKKMDEYFN